MTRLLGLLLAAVLFGNAYAEAPDSGPDEPPQALAAIKPAKVPRVPWLVDNSWAEVVALATAADQPILLDFTATWCGPCKLLDVMVFTEKPVIERLADVVTFQIDIDKPEYRSVKESFGIEVVPTVIWCDRDGREIDRFTGYVSSAQFLGILNSWRTNRTIDRTLAELQSASPQSPAVLLDLARRQTERGHDRQAEILYRRLVNLRFGTEREIVARGMLGLAGIEFRAHRAAEARRLANRAAGLPAADGSGPIPSAARIEVMLEVALFQESIGDTLGMLATYRSLAEAARDNVLVLHGYARAAVQAGVDLRGATRAALRAVVYSDEDPDVMSTLAECYYWRGLYAKAIRWQEKAAIAAPHQALYREQLKKYEVARSGDPHGLRGPPARNR